MARARSTRGRTTEPAFLAGEAIRTRIVRLSPASRRIGPLPVSLLLHAFLLALMLISFKRRQPELSLPLNGVSVVFEGTPRSGAANTAPRRGVTTQASPKPHLPPPPAPAPQPRMAQSKPDVHLGPVAPEPFQPPEAPAPRFIIPPPQPHPKPAPPRPTPHYLVMNGMSFNGPPAAPMLNPGHQGLDLRPANDNTTRQSDLVEIEGHVGSGWDSALKRWAQENGYYPEAAARLGQQGDVTVDFTIDSSGRVVADHLVAGSKSAFLNMAWYGLWHDAKVPPFPPGTKDKTVKIRFTARYMLIAP